MNETLIDLSKPRDFARITLQNTGTDEHPIMRLVVDAMQDGKFTTTEYALTHVGVGSIMIVREA